MKPAPRIPSNAVCPWCGYGPRVIDPEGQHKLKVKCLTKDCPAETMAWTDVEKWIRRAQ